MLSNNGARTPGYYCSLHRILSQLVHTGCFTLIIRLSHSTKYPGRVPWRLRTS